MPVYAFLRFRASGASVEFCVDSLLFIFERLFRPVVLLKRPSTMLLSIWFVGVPATSYLWSLTSLITVCFALPVTSRPLCCTVALCALSEGRRSTGFEYDI